MSFLTTGQHVHSEGTRDISFQVVHIPAGAAPQSETGPVHPKQRLSPERCSCPLLCTFDVLGPATHVAMKALEKPCIRHLLPKAALYQAESHSTAGLDLRRRRRRRRRGGRNSTLIVTLISFMMNSRRALMLSFMTIIILRGGLCKGVKKGPGKI